MKRKPLIKWVWIVQVCDYEGCWPLYFFDNEKKAQQYHDRYRLKGDEQSKAFYRSRVF